jgi:phosphoribosylamine--glycine ligase
MKILVIGSGGREHALVWKLSQSRRVSKIYCAPGNAGIAQIADCLPVKADDIRGLLAFALREGIDLTVVGPEAPLVLGIVDAFRREGLRIFGPTQEGARLEGSKAFAKKMMAKMGVPTADFAVCGREEEIMDAVARLGLPVVLKADGLAAGKGVVICDTAQAAREAARQMLVDKVFGEAGSSVVVEKCLFGEEASILMLTNGRVALPLASSQDHKRVFDADQGPNTGGMGAYSPAPVVTAEVLVAVKEKVIEPVLRGMEAEGALYQGVLYAGIMVTEKGPQVLEFNVRFGDPETQAVLARLDSDLFEALLWTLDPSARPPAMKWSKKSSVCVVVASGGYPGPYDKGKAISGLDRSQGGRDVHIFHAGTRAKGSVFETDGGRVLGVTALGQDLRRAVDRAYEAAAAIHFDGMHYRRDIGWRALDKAPVES